MLRQSWLQWRLHCQARSDPVEENWGSRALALCQAIARCYEYLVLLKIDYYCGAVVLVYERGGGRRGVPVYLIPLGPQWLGVAALHTSAS